MTESLSKLFSDLDLDLVRIRRPSKVVFFCGGAMAGRSSAAPGVESLRNYLINTCEIRSKISGEIVLAEGATTLYRDSGYHDLISFEEDIARLSAIILVIAESPGSLAELGAFASNDTIRKKLAIIVEHIHYDAESFIRFGPIERLRLENDSRVAVFSWESQLKNPSFGDRKNVDTQEMIDFINNLTKNTPNEELYRVDAEFQEFVIILWILYISTALGVAELVKILSFLRNDKWSGFRDLSEYYVRRKLYCMEVVSWVANRRHGDKTYWYITSSDDPFSRYRFLGGALINDPTRRKSEVAIDLRNSLKIPEAVRKIATDAKSKLK